MDIIDNMTKMLDTQHKSQRELASYLGEREQTVSHWFNRRTKSYRKHLNKIATFFDVSLDDLLGNEKQPATSNGDRLSNDEERFILWYRSLSEDEKAALKIMHKIE